MEYSGLGFATEANAFLHDRTANIDSTETESAAKRSHHHGETIIVALEALNRAILRPHCESWTNMPR